MFKKIIQKTDKFYFVFFAVMVFISFIVITSFRTVFNSLIVAYESSSPKNENLAKVNEEKLNEAYNFIFNEEVVKLELK